MLRALVKNMEVVGPGGWRAIYAKSRLGGCLIARERFEEAESSLTSSHEALGEHGQTPAEFKQRSFDRTLLLYQSWDKPEKEAAYRTAMESWQSSGRE